MADMEWHDLTTLAVDLLSAYFASNNVGSDQLAGLIRSTHGALQALNGPAAVVEPEHVPAVSVRKSLSSPEHIISLIDGKSYKTLKRHLGTHGLTPAEYRERYKLAPDYPMVSKNYSDHRRAVAEKLGLGRTVRTPMAAAPAIAETKPTTVAKKPAARKPVAKTATSPVAAAADPAPTTTKARAVRTPKGTISAPVAAADAQAGTARPVSKKRTLKLKLAEPATN